MAEPWAIQEKALETVLDIAQRTNLDPEAVQTKDGKPLNGTRSVSIRNGVAVVPIIGTLIRYAGVFANVSGATSVEKTAKEFQRAVDSGEVKHIVLEIDSPGGQVKGINELAKQIRAAQAVKPVTAYISGTGASAAYWLASAAGRIVIDETAQLGSIGIVATYPPKSDNDPILFVSSISPRKMPDPNDDEGKAILQAGVDATAEVFVSAVAQYRGVSEETVRTDFGQGGVLLGAAAVAAGMADEIGSMEELLAELAGSTQVANGGGRLIQAKEELAMAKTEPQEAPKITAAYLEENHPDLVDRFRAEGRAEGKAEGLEAGREKGRKEGADAERARIEAIDKMTLPGHEALAAECKADPECSAEQAAVKITQAEMKARTEGKNPAHLDKLAADEAQAGQAPAPASTDQPTGPSADAPLEERLKAEWAKDADLRAEFGDNFDQCLAYHQANEAGRARVLKKG